MSRILSLRLIHAMHALTSSKSVWYLGKASPPEVCLLKMVYVNEIDSFAK